MRRFYLYTFASPPSPEIIFFGEKNLWIVIGYLTEWCTQASRTNVIKKRKIKLAYLALIFFWFYLIKRFLDN